MINIKVIGYCKYFVHNNVSYIEEKLSVHLDIYRFCQMVKEIFGFVLN